MQKVKELIGEGKNKEALLLLQTQVKEEDKHTAILLLGEFHSYNESQLRNTEAANPTLLNNILWRALQLCDKQDSPTKHKPFAELPILDNLPLDKDGYLLGRKAALEELHAALQGQSMLTLVNGMGGIGKSTLASFYANFPKYRAAYSHCYWVAVSDLTGEIEDALISAFAAALELYQIPKEAQLQKIEAYLSGLQGQTLLILDNANDKEKVRTALAFLRKCKTKVLFTSRANMTNIPSQALAKLLPEDAFTLFTHYFPAASVMPETPQLLKNIDYHTLLTEFMAKSLAHNPVLSLQDLVEITQQQNFTDELLAYTQFTSYHTHTHGNEDAEIQPAKYLLQIFPIQNLSEQEQAILRYFSILPTEWIEMEMLLQLFAADKEKTTRLQLGQVLQSLHEKGWLQKSPTNAFACHILLQHLLRQQLEPNAENCKLLLENLYAATWFDGYTNLLTLAPYLPLVVAVLSWIKDETKLISDIYNNSAVIYEAMGNYAQALSYDLENVRIKEKILAADDVDLATAYNNIAGTYEYLGDYQKSLEYGLKTVSIFEKVLSAEHTNLATSYNNIAGTYEKLGDYQKALEYDLKALSIREKVLSAEHPSLATSYNNIAITYYYLDDYQKSLEYGLKALSIKEKVLSAEHPSLADSYDNIGVTYSKLSNHQKALEYGLKALSIREKVLSAEHPSLAISYGNIAWTYYYLKDYITAHSFIQKAVAILLKVLPKEHPHIQVILKSKTVIEEAMHGK
jgi:tetratricopeptide (TPR) repeat protein